MLQIRKKQMFIFKKYMLKQYEDRIQKHLHRRFPKKCNVLGERGVRETICDGIQRSETYGVVSESDVQRYIEWMIMLGPRFDMDSKTAWAGEILRNKKLKGFEKMDRIDSYAIVMRSEQ